MINNSVRVEAVTKISATRNSSTAAVLILWNLCTPMKMLSSRRTGQRSLNRWVTSRGKQNKAAMLGDGG